MISPGPLQELLTRTCIQDHAQASDSISLGSPEDLRTRNCKRPWARSSRQDPEEKLTRYRHKRTCRCSGLQVCPATLGGGIFPVNSCMIIALVRYPCAFRLRKLWACGIFIVCRKAHGHVTRAILCDNLQEKDRRPKSRGRRCGSMRSRNAWTRHGGHSVREFRECGGTDGAP